MSDPPIYLDWNATTPPHPNVIAAMARAAGEVRLTRRARTRRFTLREVPLAEAGPVLKRYIAIAPATRDFFTADRNAPVDAFTAEAGRHPVFELVPVEPGMTSS